MADITNSRKGKDSDKENWGKKGPKKNGEGHRISVPGRSSGNKGRGRNNG